MSICELEDENDLKELFYLIDELKKEDEMSAGDSLVSPSGQSSMIQKQRNSKRHYRKPPFKASFIPELRILKRDIRRTYPDMLSNVMNSHDVKLFSSFVDKFYRNECIMAQTFPEGAPACFNSVEVRGVEVMKRLQGMHYLMTPDSVMNVSNSQVCKRLYESGSRVLGSFNVKGTVIYIPKVYNGKPVDPNDPILDYDLDHNEFLAYEKTEDFLEQLQLATKPLNLQFMGSYEMILDANHRVERFTISWLSFDISYSSFSTCVL